MANNKSVLTNENEHEKKQTSSRQVPFAVVESYKTIRTNLSFLTSASDSKIICFSSANAGDGKSTTSVNVAIAFAQLGKKTLLIDADLRRSSVHKKLKLDSKPGLSNVLAGMVTFDEAVKKTGITLDVLTAGQIPPNPSETLGSAKFQELLKAAEEKYDHIIIDTPPINIVSDALIVGAITNGIVLVVKEGVNTIDEVEHAVSAANFAGIRILGVVMNGVNSKRGRYGYRKHYKKYGYRYGYKYGYKYGYRYGYTYGNNSKQSKLNSEQENARQ